MKNLFSSEENEMRFFVEWKKILWLIDSLIPTDDRQNVHTIGLKKDFISFYSKIVALS